MAIADSTARSIRVAIYARVSTADQSTEPQLLDLRRYTADRGWRVFREYHDDGISGTKDSRPALTYDPNELDRRVFLRRPRSFDPPSIQDSPPPVT